MLVPHGANLGPASGRLLLASLLLVTGCSSTVGGKPVAGPGAGPAEPSFPTSRPSPPPATSAPTSAPPTTPSPPTAPAGAIPLPPDDQGYVYIETKSGKTRCQIATESVGCEAPFTNSPIKDGEHANGISITAGGTVEWILGNLGAIPTVTIDYHTYGAQGWTIAADTTGTRFTNDHTGHGMFLSIDNVDTF